MSNIPDSALSSALSPISRQANDAARARKLQQQKNAHHADDIEELNDSGVDSIDDRKQEKNNRGQPEEQKSEENVEIASLNKQPPPPKNNVPQKTTQLDISA